MEFFPKLLSTLESNALAESFKDFIELYGFGLWAVELKESNEFIGFVGLSIPTIIFPSHPALKSLGESEVTTGDRAMQLKPQEKHCK
jgi:hypothetical protein